MARRYLVALCVLLVSLVIGGLWFMLPWVFSPHYTIRVASGPAGSETQNFIAAFKREIAEERPRLRLEVTPSESLDASAKAFSSGRFDLAIVRSDHPVAALGGTLAIMRRQALVVLTGRQMRVASVRDLVGKKVALLDSTAVGDPLLGAVCAFYGMRPENLLPLPADEIGRALKDKRVAAALMIGGLGPGPLTESVKSVARALGGSPRFIALDAKAIVAQSPVYEPLEIPKAVFSTAPPMPGEAVESVGVAVRLVARNAMFDNVAAEITRLLFATRARVAATLPGVGQIEAPDTDRASVLAVHPGAANYFNGSVPSIFEQAMDQLFNFSIIGGVLGSVVIFFANLWRRRRENDALSKIWRLMAMLREAKALPIEQLAELEDELDTLSGDLLGSLLRDEIGHERAGGISALVGEIRTLIDRRRRAGGVGGSEANSAVRESGGKQE